MSMLFSAIDLTMKPLLRKLAVPCTGLLRTTRHSTGVPQSGLLIEFPKQLRFAKDLTFTSLLLSSLSIPWFLEISSRMNTDEFSLSTNMGPQYGLHWLEEFWLESIMMVSSPRVLGMTTTSSFKTHNGRLTWDLMLRIRPSRNWLHLLNLPKSLATLRLSLL